jgi:GABA permease
MTVGAEQRLLSRAVLVVVALAAVLAAAALAMALAFDPPSLMWIGFAALSLVVVALGLAATLAVPPLRVSPPVPAVARDPAHRLLVVADAVCSPPALADAIARRSLDDIAVHLVVPVRVSRLHFVADDESQERRQAAGSLAHTLRLLHARGLAATGAVGDDKPLESMTDALGTFAATHVLLATPPERESYWLERELLPKAQALAAVKVEQVVVPASLPAEPVAADV